MLTGIVVDVTAAERDRLKAIVADRNSPKCTSGAPGSCWPPPTGPARWRSCTTPRRSGLPDLRVAMNLDFFGFLSSAL